MRHLTLLTGYLLLAAACSGTQRKPGRDDVDSISNADTDFFRDTEETDSAQMDGAKLREAVSYIRNEGLAIHSMIVVQNWKIVSEYYADEYDAESVFNIESCTKSIVSVLTGMAIEEGLIGGVDTRVLDVLDDIELNSRSDGKEDIAIADLLSMRSGLDWDNRTESFMNEAGVVSYILSHDMRDAPGSNWAYSSADTQLIGAVIKKTSGKSLGEYAREKLFDPLGISPGKWMVDGDGNEVAGYGLQLTLRDMAKFGLLVLNNGKWQNQQLVSPGWIEESLKLRAETPWQRGDFGYSFWLKRFGDGYCAGGRYGQQINIFPKDNLVVVYTASLPLETADSILDAITQVFVLETLSPDILNEVDTDSESVSGSNCERTDMEWIAGDNGLSHAKGVYSFGDDISTRCLHDVSDGRMCLRGHGADAGAEYDHWGAGMAIRLAVADEDGLVTAPFDATNHGIHGVGFSVEGTESLPFGMRVGMTMVNRDDIQYEFNSFIIDGGASGDIKQDGATQFSFTRLSQPFWSNLSGDPSFDSEQIHTLRFQIVTQPGAEYDFDFCISNIHWLDDSMQSISPAP